MKYMKYKEANTMLLENTTIDNEEIQAVEPAAEMEQPLELEMEVPKKKKKKAAKAEPKQESVEEVNVGELILDWKKEYKRIFKNEVDGDIIIWRRLKRKEYKEILAYEDEDEENRIMTKQEMMVKKAVLYPFNVDELIEENAGIATVLSEEILAKSGFAISYTEEL